MSGFSADWLSLREPADLRSRDEELADALRTRFLQRDTVSVVDLGCGTGANLRALAPLLPETQWWTLVDYDPALLLAAKRALAAWATETDGHREDEDILGLRYGRKTISVYFHQADINPDLEAVLDRDQPMALNW